MFRQGKKEDANTVFQLILDRIDWMNEVGIDSWNKNGYIEYYDLDFFKNEADLGHLYVLEEDNKIVSAIVLLEEDTRWPDHKNAYYLHNFVSSKDYKGAGKRLKEEVIKYARVMEKDAVRLDSDVRSDFLAKFYGSFGFVAKGECSENYYNGILRELNLR